MSVCLFVRNKLRLCLLESMRIEAPVNGSTLVPDKTYKCPFAKLSALGPCMKAQSETLTLPARTPLCLSLISHAMNEVIWPEPDQFKPYERNLDGDDTRYVMFNGVGTRGPRICPGRDVSMELMISALQMIYSPSAARRTSRHLPFWTRAVSGARGIIDDFRSKSVDDGFGNLYKKLRAKQSDSFSDVLEGSKDDVVKAWTAIALLTSSNIRDIRDPKSIKAFTPKMRQECGVMVLQKEPLLNLRFVDVDEDSSALTDRFEDLFGQSVLACSHHVTASDEGGSPSQLYYYESPQRAYECGQEIFSKAIPQPDTTSMIEWDHATIGTLDGLSTLVFYGLGQAYLSGEIKSTQAAQLHLSGADVHYEVDLSFLYAYKVRSGYESYGAIAYFNSEKVPIAIWWCHGQTMVYPSSSNVADASEEWIHAMASFRSALCVAITVKDHLAWTHIVIANSLLLATRETLSETHPLRRLLKPHVFQTASINKAASQSLLVNSGVSYHGFGFTKDDYIKTFVDCVELFTYVPFPQWCQSKGLSASDLGQLPLFQDGLELWYLIHSYVSSYLSIFYPQNDLDIEKDEELKAYWAHFGQGKQQFGAKSFGFQSLSFANLVDQVTYFIFAVSAGHEVYGSIVEYLLHPNVLPPKLAIGRNESDLQTYHLALSLIALTGNRMPALMSDWNHLHKYLKDDNAALPKNFAHVDMQQRLEMFDNVKQVNDRFRASLEDQSVVVDSRNVNRNRTPLQKAFNGCNPRVLECSVSV
jgi:hypothetical protein